MKVGMIDFEYKKIVLGIILAAGLVGLYFLNPQFHSPTTQEIFCTMEAKQCPDGSYVGRGGPHCEFAPCSPIADLPAGYDSKNYKIEKITGETCRADRDCRLPGEYAIQSRCPFFSVCLKDSGCAVVCPNYFREPIWKDFYSNGMSFSYPEKLIANYISVVDWPPQIKILNEQIVCVESGSEINRTGKTEKRLVDNWEYCRTTVSEGAAGSVYRQYTYTFTQPVVGIITFSLRYPQCANYDEPIKAECEAEQQAFDVDSFADRIIRTLKTIQD